MRDIGRRFRCGYVAIIGRPNVGKSTLLNRILGQKLSITSSKPQTTRHRLLGIKTTGTYQAILVDTPGIHFDRKRAINRYMTRTATGTLAGVDLIAFVVEALRWTEEDAQISARLVPTKLPTILAVNKVDRVRDKVSLLPFLEEVSHTMDFVEIVPLSAHRGDNIKRFEELVVSHMPVRSAMFPADQITDRSERFVAAELIREKLIRRLGQELPYRLAVEIEEFKDEKKVLRVGAIIWVEGAGQKAIVIGKGGHALKTAGSQARRDMEKMFDKKVFLNLWVKIKAGWSDNERLLKSMGYDEP